MFDSLCVPLEFLSRFACIFHDVVMCFVFVCVFRKRKPIFSRFILNQNASGQCLSLVESLYRSRMLTIIDFFEVGSSRTFQKSTCRVELFRQDYYYQNNLLSDVRFSFIYFEFLIR